MFNNANNKHPHPPPSTHNSSSRVFIPMEILRCSSAHRCNTERWTISLTYTLLFYIKATWYFQPSSLYQSGTAHTITQHTFQLALIAVCMSPATWLVTQNWRFSLLPFLCNTIYNFLHQFPDAIQCKMHPNFRPQEMCVCWWVIKMIMMIMMIFNWFEPLQQTGPLCPIIWYQLRRALSL
jgi:hypothetical protein